MDSWPFLLFAACLIVSFQHGELAYQEIQPEEIFKAVRELLPEQVFKSTIISKISEPLSGNFTKCDIHYQFFLTELKNRKLWALKMLDASSKFPSGILIGNLKDIGMYDECLSIEIETNSDLIQGHHCMYTLQVHQPLRHTSLTTSLSICMPATCSDEQVFKLIQNVVNETTQSYKVRPDLKSVKCFASESKPWGTGEIIVTGLFALFLTFLVICTICDIYYRMTTPRLEDNFIFETLLKFSMYSNAQKVLSMKVPAGNLPAIQGIRFISISWIVLGHEYFLQLLSATVNQADFLPWTHSWNGLYIMIAPFSVDTFFTISGFLTSYLFLKEIWKGRRFNPIMYYLHRYLRLTPSLGVLLLFMIFIAPRLGSGAIWESNIVLQQKACSKHWWEFMLYIQNFIGAEGLNCLGHTWYLAVDMHLFLISPLILYPLAKSPKTGLVILGGFIIASMIIPAMIALKHEYSGGLFVIPSFLSIKDLLVDYYIVSYNRAGPWLLGVFLGYKIATKKGQPSNGFIWFGWVMAIIAFAFIMFTYKIFQSDDYEFNDWWETFYNGTARHIWAFGICWIIYASNHGYGGIISRLLSMPVFIPFGRISYSVYLIHYVYELMRISSIRVPDYFSDYRTINSFIADYIFIILISFLFCVIFESPFLAIEKLILGKKKPMKHETKKELKDDDAEIGANNIAYDNHNISSYSIKNGNL